MKKNVEAMGFAVNPWLQADGGDYNPVDVDDGVVHVCLKGACASGFTSQRPLMIGKGNSLQNKVSNVYAVEAVSSPI